jgi:cobalt-zinc-cadmium efflux system membrane fusion protein
MADEKDTEEAVAEERRLMEQAESPDGTIAVVETKTSATAQSPPRAGNRNALIVTIVALIAIIILVALLLRSRDGGSKVQVGVTEKGESTQPPAEHGDDTKEGAGREVALPQEALAAAGIEIAGVTQRPAVALLKVTGAVEANQQQTQEVTPLVAGRVEQVFAALGDRVGAGSTLAVIASPQIAELQGQLGAAETRLRLGERNYARVQRAENRAGIIAAKAKLDEAEATLRRTRRLIELGAGAGKDLIAAEAAYKTAKAEYDFQSNISLNREVQEAQAAVETARAEVLQIKQSLNALGASGGKTGSTVTLRAPASGIITARAVNAGAGVEVGKPLFTISNISTVWVIANVPEAQVGLLHPGTPAEVRSAALGDSAIMGRVTYIDPVLSEETRTARVRVEVANSGERLKVGMFTEVGFQTGTGEVAGEELVVPSEAVQRVGSRTVVFIPEEKEPGHFEVREVEVGGETAGYARIVSGLKMGERVVTKGSFTLKSQMMKGQFGEDDDK